MRSVEILKEKSGLKGDQMERLRRLVDAIMNLLENKFTGSIRINFTQGSIGRVEKFEEILKK